MKVEKLKLFFFSYLVSVEVLLSKTLKVVKHTLNKILDPLQGVLF